MQKARLARCLCGLLVLAAAAIAEEQRPTYYTRLVSPLSEDEIGYPEAVTSDLGTGETFVCDARRNRILIFDADDLFLYEIAGGSVFSSPIDLAVDREGHLLVLAVHQRQWALIQLDFDGRFMKTVPFSGVPESAASPSLTSIALSPSGERLYVLDVANLKLWIAQRDGRVIKTVDLGGDLSRREGKDVILGKVDVYGDRVLVAIPSDGMIHLFDLDGEPQGSIGRKGTGPCKLGFPAAAALDVDGNLVIVDQQRMLLVRWSVDENRCLGDYYGPGTAPGFFYYPLDLTLNASGHVYVIQGMEGRAQAYKGLAAAAGSPPPPAESEPTDGK